MPTDSDAANNPGGQGKASAASAAPSISLPKGGGAIRGMGEKFAANPVTGTGSMSVPLAVSPGRAGFGPQLALSYDSGAGNGPFGFGWSLSTPSITRKTDKGLPRYDDATETDVFILSGAEDLVPLLNPDRSRFTDVDTAPGFTIHRYRPRIEGLFARIERWTNTTNPADVHWRSISKDNILSLYGKDENSRIADPADASHIFTWLICETRDDKGNAVLYKYKAEDGKDLDLTQAHEANRGDANDARRNVNRYIKHVYSGNRTPLLVGGRRPRFLTQDQINGAGWMFEVVFDYGEHSETNPTPRDPGDWKRRNDPFSSYRSSFEVRTYRLCQRVLMFHHFDGEAGVGNNCLVRSTDFTYSYEENLADAHNPIYSFLLSATQTGYKRDGATGYLKKSLPPVEFEYTEPIVQDAVQEVDAESLENLPIGLDGAAYQWTDLHGEGIPGILTEQAGAWFYKRNLSPINGKRGNGVAYIEAEFAPVELVATRPNLALAGGAQFMDLAGDGQPDLVVLDGPMPGFYEHDDAEGWQPFRSFTARLNRDTRDPNLKFVDLDGDGHADVLISEDDAFVWHPSLAEAGFGTACRVAQALDEEKGPRLIFADGTQSIYLADLSGDGLTDLARIRNGEVCYWPNLGYGRFGAKVTMDHAPTFDNPDQFDHKRIRLADIDGSGTTDIIYLHRDGARLYFNQSGNSWSAPQTLNIFPRVDDLVSIVSTDLLGNGTACLVWSSPLPGDARRPMRYVNLMGGQKPHLLVKTINNLGAETRVDYAPSAKFYLQDKRDGKPWITRLPFPVHVVEKVTVTDKWRGTTSTSSYSYHHGYFDGEEREFRGFGRVEQLDVEDYGTFAAGNAASPYITNDKTLYQPPVKTVTWYHTGAFLDRERITSHFKHEYFPRWLEERYPGKVTILGGFHENDLPEPDLEAENLSAEEWREALRACKGMMLRQEVVELDVDALERPVNPEQLPVKLFSTAYHNCAIRRLQPKDVNRHAVFLVAESEAITYHYELDIREEQLPQLDPDPRIAHTLNLQFDEYANVLQSVAVVYPRLGKFEDDVNLAEGLADALSLIRQVQKEETHLAYSETRYTEDFGTKPADKIAALDNHRLRLPCEVLTYELTGIIPESGLHFTLDELRAFQLSRVHQSSGEAVQEISYHQLPDRTVPLKKEKRLVEHARTLFFAENLVDPLPFREHGRLGLTYEAYKLALTGALLDAVYKDAAGNNKLDQTIDGATTARARLDDPVRSGYLSGAKLVARFASIPAIELTGQYWIRSGIAGFAPDAAQHFYLPERYTDPFDNTTTLAYDPRDLFVAFSTDAMSNTTRVTQFDFRVLAPREIRDLNDNLSEVYFDVLGLPAAMAVKGKGNEGDNLIGFTDALANPELAELTAFFDAPAYDETQARRWLGNTTARHVYYFGETRKADGSIIWAAHPACACRILREQHVSQLGPGEVSPSQAAFECSDGLGSVVVKKIQAEPDEAVGPALRWVANGKTILNNKGKPVKQYEPYFSSSGHRCEEPKEEGVTPVVYYDAVGRAVRTEMPDGSYSRVEFSPWHVRTFDQNDTVKEAGNAWFANNTAATAMTEEKRAAQLAAEHAGTPALTILDSLGRDVISIAHNRVKDAAGDLKDEKYLTFTRLDAEGKSLWIRDARKNLVMQYISPPAPNNQATDPVTGFAPCYDIAGNLLFQHSMDAGDRWTLNDAAGKPMVAWDSLGHIFRTDYDALHRPVGSFVKGADRLDPNRVIQFDKVIYGDTPGNGLSDTPANDQTRKLNLRGKPYKHHDTAGLVVSLGRNPVTGTDEAFDFKGNLLRGTRQLVKDTNNTPDWSQAPALEAETFANSGRFDALNRVVEGTAPDGSVTLPRYNEANLLEAVEVRLRGAAQPTPFVRNIDYNAKGQRTRIEYNKHDTPIITEYTYDRDTFRLTHLVTKRPNHPDSDKRTLQDLRYTFDPVGNITHIQDDAQPRVFFDNACIDASNDYRYDALYRLVAASGREHKGQNLQPNWDDSPRTGNPIPYNCSEMRQYVETYRYDEVGNILQMVHHIGANIDSPGAVVWNRRYQYRTGNNMLRCTSVPGEAVLPDYADDPAPQYAQRYAYDVHGNMTAMPHLQTMHWDFENQLSEVDLQGGGTAYYVYDAAGQRVRKVIHNLNDAKQKERIYLGGFEIYREYNAATRVRELERETLHIIDDKQRIALVETRTDTPVPAQLIRYQFGNHLGSVSLELDNQAQVISYEEYSPYGSTAYQAARSNTETPKRYRYTGKERDEETGFTYHKARYYAPWLGRWTRSDPAGLTDGTNLYTYAAQNPVVFIDPNGTDWQESIPGGPGVERSGPGSKDPPALTAEENEQIRLKGVRSQAEADAEGTYESIERATYLNDIKYRNGFTTGEFGKALIDNLNRQGESMQIGIPAPPEDTFDTTWEKDHWEPNITLDKEFISDPAYQAAYLAKFDSKVAEAEGRRADEAKFGPVLQAGGGPRRASGLPRVRPHGEPATPGAEGQSHHINQNAAFRDVVPAARAASVGLPGNAFTEPGTPHYEFHKSLEAFWEEYRTGIKVGKVPTVGEYNEATRKALIAAGLKPDVAKFVADIARRQLVLSYGMTPASPVPNVPYRLNQRKP